MCIFRYVVCSPQNKLYCSRTDVVGNLGILSFAYRDAWRPRPVQTGCCGCRVRCPLSSSMAEWILVAGDSVELSIDGTRKSEHQMNPRDRVLRRLPHSFPHCPPLSLSLSVFPHVRLLLPVNELYLPAWDRSPNRPSCFCPLTLYRKFDHSDVFFAANDWLQPVSEAGGRKETPPLRTHYSTLFVISLLDF